MNGNVKGNNVLGGVNLQDYNIKELHSNFTLENLEKALLNIFKVFKEGKNIKNENLNKSLINFNLCTNVLEILLDLCYKNIDFLSKNGFLDVEKKIKEALFQCNKNIKEINNLISSNTAQTKKIIKTPKIYRLLDNKHRDLMDVFLIKPLIYPKIYGKENRSLLLYGNNGSGKSYIIQSSINFLEGKADVLIFDFKDIINNSIEEIKKKFSIFMKEADSNILSTKKLIVVIENIEIFFTNDINNHMVVSSFKNCLNNENIYLIATSNLPYLIPSEILCFFDLKEYIDLPNQNNIYNFIQYFVLDYLNIFNTDNKKMLQKFNIPFLKKRKEIKKFSKLCYDKKFSYHDLKKIINKAFIINGKSSKKSNSFQELHFSVGNKKIGSFFSCFSIKKEFIRTDKKYILNEKKKPIISVCEGSKCKFSTNFSLLENTDLIYKNFDDERVENTYVNLDSKNRNNLEIITEININLNNNYSNFESDKNRLKISEISIRLYMQLCNLIFQNIEKIKLTNRKKLIDIHKKIPNGFNSFNDILFLDEKDLNSLFNIISIPNTQKKYDIFYNNYSNIFNNLNQIIEIILPENKQGSAVISLIYNNSVMNKIKLTEAINPNLLRKYLLLLLDKRLVINEITEKSRAFINDIPCNIEVIYVKTSGGYSWYIDIIPEFQRISTIDIPNLYFGLFKMKLLNKEYKSYPTINLDIFSRKLNINYKITNESDVSILQEKFPNDYGEIYRDEEETWMLQTIKKTEHLEMLNSIYNDYSITFLNIYHNLLEYKKTNNGNLGMESLLFLEKIIEDIQYKIDQLLVITVPYDENNEEIAYWNASKNHRHYVDSEYDEDINRSSIFYREKYDKSYGLNLLINIFKVTGFSNIKYCYEYYKTSLYCGLDNINRSIFVHSFISNDNIDQYYYSNYLNEINNNSKLNCRNLETSKEYIKYFYTKIIKCKSYYMEIFNTIKHIGYMENGEINWYILNKTPEGLKKKVLIGDFIIRNNSKEILFSLLENVTNNQYINIISSYIITVLCYHYNNNIDIFPTILGVYLYNKEYITYFKNNSVKEVNIISMFNNDLNHFLSIIDKRFEVFSNNYNSIPIISKTQMYNYFQHIKNKKGKISENRYVKSNKKIFSERIINLEYHQEEKKAYEKFGITKNMINNSLSSMNFKIEFLEDSFINYENIIDLEKLHKLQEFRRKYN